MNARRKAVLFAGFVAALLGVSTAAYAADPVDLAPGSLIYQANYSSDPTAVWTTASDGAANVIGGSATSISDVVDGAWNPATNRSYLIGNGYGGPCELWEVDITTGALTFIAIITGDNGDTTDCDAFDIAPDGTAWVTLYDGGTPTLAKLNLADGTTTDPVTLNGVGGISWIVIQPGTGVMFLGTFDADLYTVNTTTGDATLVEGSGFGDGLSFYDAAFDSAGRLWVSGWGEVTELFSADVSNYAATFVSQGLITLSGSGAETGTDSLWIVRGAAPPVLAATGTDVTLPVALSLALLLLGAGALGVRRSRKA